MCRVQGLREYKGPRQNRDVQKFGFTCSVMLGVLASANAPINTKSKTKDMQYVRRFKGGPEFIRESERYFMEDGGLEGRETS